MTGEGFGRRRARWVLMAAAVVCLAMSSLERRAIEKSPSYKPYLSDVTVVTGVGDAGTLAILAVLGGFRAAAANMLWLKSDYYWHLGSAGWWKMRPIFDVITRLDPHFVMAWRTFGWHVAWNLYADAAPEDKPRYLKEGEDIFRRGVHANPNSWELRMELAWLYQDRIRDAGKAIPLWWDVVRKPRAPIYNWHMLAHAYSRTLNWKKSLETWGRVLEIDPTDMVARRHLARWRRAMKDPALLRQELLRVWKTEQAIRHSRGIPTLPEPEILH
jgi:tetratricopeptide (TPR) repeat protein